MYRVLFWVFYQLLKVTTAKFVCGAVSEDLRPPHRGSMVSSVNTIPWLGSLLYPDEKVYLSTSVILITREMVIASSSDIDNIPKLNFRETSRVYLGQNCSGDGIGILEYSYHPEFNNQTLSSLTLIQLDMMTSQYQELVPICTAHTKFDADNVYAISLSQDCRDPRATIYKMYHVRNEDCLAYYKERDLNIASVWPKNYSCGKSDDGEECIWQSGTALVSRSADNVWSLLGFGVLGPGCSAPARFLDYGAYKPWVKRSITRTATPSVARLADNDIIFRRKSTNLYRYGPCDPEETKIEIYTDHMKLDGFEDQERRKVYYNLTISSDVEYTCVLFKAIHDSKSFKPLPTLNLTRYCSTNQQLCYDFGHITLDLSVKIEYSDSFIFFLFAYGRPMRILDAKKYLAYVNQRRPVYVIPTPPYSILWG